MRVAIIILAFFAHPISIFGQMNYYVSWIGNDANSGSFAMPWKTIQHGLNQLNANDTLNVLAGTYTEKIIIPSDNIYLRHYLSHVVVVDAIGISTQNAIISISNKSNITIDGLELKNSIQNDAQGILIDGSGANITIKNCIIHDIHFSSNPSATVNATKNAQGIIVYGSHSTTPITNLKILNNQLYNCRLGYSEGIAVNGNVDGFEVVGNLVFNLTNIGIDIIGHEGTCPNASNDQARNGLVKNNIVHDCLSLYATSGGIYIDGGKRVTVENNTSYRNGYGIEVGCENINKVTDAIDIRNNIFYDNEICAIALGGYAYPSGSGKVTNTVVRNNTCYYNNYSLSGNGELSLSYSENTIIENNIFYTNTQNVLSYAELTQPSISFNYNIVYCVAGAANLVVDWNGNSYTGYAAFTTGSGTNSNSIFGNPQFALANISNPNFHLAASSIAINTGNPSFIPSASEVDIDAESRANGRVDCGADEYYTTTAVLENSAYDPYLIYPNPIAEYLSIKNIIANTAIEIYNQLGQLELKTVISPNEQIYIGHLPNGCYYIHYTDLEYTQVFIKQQH